MAQKSLEELVEIALDMNIESKKVVLSRLKISERTWSKWIKDTGIYFEKSVGAYIVPSLAKASGDNVTNLNNFKASIEEAISSDKKEESKQEALNLENNKEPEYLDVMEVVKKVSKGEKMPLDKVNIANRVEDLPIYAGGSEEESKKTHIVDDKVAQDLPKETETNRLEFIKEKFMITKDIKKALRCKALTEGVEVDELVRDLLLQSIENKYFMGLEKSL